MTKLNFSLVLCIFCTGCLAALIPSPKSEIELTELTALKNEIDAYFVRQTEVCQNAQAVLDELAGVRGKYHLSEADTAQFLLGLSEKHAPEVPAHLTSEEKSSLEALRERSASLDDTLKATSDAMNGLENFVGEKTTTIGKEVAQIRLEYEQIKRNPLATRQDKGRAANQIRAANKLADGMKSTLKSQTSELMALQTKTIGALKNWTLQMAELKSNTILAAEQAAKNKVAATTDAVSENVSQAVENEKSKVLDKSKALIGNAENGLKKTSGLLGEHDRAVNKVKSVIKEKTAGTKKVISEEADRTIEEVDAKVRSSVEISGDSEERSTIEDDEENPSPEDSSSETESDAKSE